jgi:hypothetical protein
MIKMEDILNEDGYDLLRPLGDIKVNIFIDCMKRRHKN